MRERAIEETWRAKGRDYIMLAADALERGVVAMTEGGGVQPVEDLAAKAAARGCMPD